MAVKAYTTGNYFYLEFENGVKRNDAKSFVVVLENPATPGTYLITSDHLGEHIIALADLQDESAAPYNQSTWEAFFQSETGFNGAAGGSLDPGTGWAAYNDTQYTDASPLSISQGATATLDIDAVSKIESQLPIGVSSYWDVGNSADGMNFTLGFKGRSSSNTGSATLGIDIGGGIGQIFKRNSRFPRGSGTNHDFYFSSQGYQLGTFLANGGVPKITSDAGTTSIFDITLQVHRTHKAR